MRSQTGPRISTRVANQRTFLEDVTPVESVHGHNRVEEKDPHDLAFSSRHVTRASVVDNMLLALDEFSNPDLDTVANHENSNANPSNKSNSLQRGTNLSADHFSDNDSNPDEFVYIRSHPRNKESNRNSNPMAGRGPQQVLNLLEEEEEESTSRRRFFDTQRAFAPSGCSYTGFDRRSEDRRTGFTSPSIDLGHNLESHAMDLRSRRRSRSFDYGSNRQRFPLFEDEAGVGHDSYNFVEEMEAAPMPIVRAGPSRGHSPARPQPCGPVSPLYDTGLTSRRGSTKSSKSQYTRRDRAATRRSTTNKDHDDLHHLNGGLGNLPPVPRYTSPPTQSPTLSSTHQSQATLSDGGGQPSKERSGFFRRVFGSRSPSGHTRQATEIDRDALRDTLPSSPPQETVRAGAGMSRVHEASSNDPHLPSSTIAKGSPALTKKTSAFFRRRKKPGVDQPSAPSPLTLHQIEVLQQAGVKAAEPSPVSSLRQVMNPYLADASLSASNASLRDLYTDSTISPQHTGNGPVEVVKGETAAAKSEPRSSQALKPSLKFGVRSKGSQVDAEANTFFVDSPTTDTASPTLEQTIFRSSSGSGPATGTLHSSPRQKLEEFLPVRFPFTSKNSASSDGISSVQSESESRHSDVSASPTILTDSAPSKIRRPSTLKLSNQGTGTGEEANEAVESAPPTGSDMSVYKSALTSPIATGEGEGIVSSVKDQPGIDQAPTINVTASPDEATQAQTAPEEDQERALKIFENRVGNIEPGEASAWLGDEGEARGLVRAAYMDLYDWTGTGILTALRELCARITLKGETQQVDRMLDSFSKRWCDCNRDHGFKSSGKSWNTVA
jgi:hypothetical protein